ncbi:hypothetical protein N7466_009628 [Penicillium verhagenii]|uniref:uncharacterized protein n=1 Tax=Penicillium verhagenii TaxID=1562060 RepID=UPI00254552C6|nr:uncharacterized protein N7466_009628 [Penicillium verhagenii]KAJ5921302.1 hypothetical protein N7466_009628 [Penicillium verhagenii]
MDSQQQPLGVGSLSSLASSIIASSTSTPYTLASYTPYSHFATPTSTPTPHFDTPNDKGDMHQWSSLIGIIAALIGNVMISLALNIQRYAHIRISREYELDKLQKEDNWREARTGDGASDSYGSVEDDGSRNRSRGRLPPQNRRSNNERREFEAYRDDENETASGRRNGNLSPGNNMRDSFASDRTARPDDMEGRKSYLRSPYWWAGIILMVLGETGNFMAYGFAPASIVSPLGVVALISNCVIAPCLLKEQFRGRDFWGVLISIAGAVVVVLSAKSSEEKLGPEEIWARITTWEFETYLGLTTGLICVLMWGSYQYGPRSILIDVGLVALFGGYTALSTKGVSSLLSFTLWHVITYPITYLLVFILISSALMQIRYINRALQRFDSTQVIPTQFVLFTLSVIIGSAVLYRDFNSMSAVRGGKFVGGCLMTFLGVYFITSGRVRSDGDSTFSSEDEEEAIGLLNGERYHDGIDLSPPAQPFRAAKALQPAGIEYNDLQSPGGSLTSHGIDGVDDNEPTPRGILSPAPSSPTGSLTADSALSGPSFENPSPLRPPSRMSNPWAEFQDQPIGSPKSDPEVHRPVTPPAHGKSTGTESTVLLQFPPAPGMDDGSPSANNAGLRRASTPAVGGSPQLGDRAHTTLETPTRRALRNSISNRFSPGTLLPTLSGGFSAVVAESLRRGEGSPYKDRSGRRKAGRRRQVDGIFADGSYRDHDGDVGPLGETDGLDTPLTLATARLQSATNLEPSADAGRSTPALATEIYNSPTLKGNDEVTRLRSFSDSWNGGLAWLGGALRRTSHSENVQSEAVTQGTATPLDGETSSAQSGGPDSTNADP